MEKRKPGIYAQWYTIIGLNRYGQKCYFLIYSSQANTYAKAVKFWNEMWGDSCTAFTLRNSEPFDESLALCA